MRIGLAGAAVAAALLAGCGEVPSGTRSGAQEPEFPIAGRWVWNGTQRWLPAREVGCGAGQAHLALLPHAIAVERDGWRLPAFTVIDWKSEPNDRLTLRIEDNGGDGKRRLKVRLDHSSPAFIRATEVTDEAGRPLGAYGDALAGAFTLLRCPDQNLDVTAWLRGAQDDTKVIR